MSMTPFLCLRAVDLVKRTLQAIGLVFVLGSTTTHAGLSPPQPLMISVQLVSRETLDFSISYPPHLYEITTSPSLKLHLPMAQSSKEFQPQSQNGIVVNSTTAPGSTSCAHLITSMRPTMEYSLPSVLRTPNPSGAADYYHHPKT